MNNKKWNNRATARRRCYYMKKEKTIKDIVEKSNKAYNGKFWNRHIEEFQTWKENQKWEESFKLFCSRMWLDNEDENLTLPAAGNRLSKQDYINKHEKWLVQKFLENDGYV
jgi:hypothetical protein